MIYFKIEVNEDLELSVRAQRAALKSTWNEIGLMWQRKFLATHFTTQAYARYGYSPRTPAYNYRKQREAKQGKGVEGGGLLPLVYSGLTRRNVIGILHRQSAYPSRVTIHLTTPSYITTNYKPASVKANGRDMPQLGKELLTVSQAEHEELRRYGESRLRTNSLAEFKKRRTRRTIQAK